jgi:hypothetical protein
MSAAAAAAAATAVSGVAAHLRKKVVVAVTSCKGSHSGTPL